MSEESGMTSVQRPYASASPPGAYPADTSLLQDDVPTHEPKRTKTTDGKAARGRATSCRECIRLKLKCSREWPCTSCVRRGCDKICPEGELPHREHLKQSRAAKASLVRDNARDDALEAAFQLGRLGAEVDLGPCADLPLPAHLSASGSAPAQPAATTTANPFDLARTSDLSPQSGLSRNSPVGGIAGLASPDEPANALEAAVGCGPGVMEVQGSSPRFHGRGAGALFCIDSEAMDQSEMDELHLPFGIGGSGVDRPTPALFPPYAQAQAYVSIYFEHVDWMYQPCSAATVERDLSILYGGGGGAAAVSANFGGLHPHRVATLLLIFALAETFARPLIPTNATDHQHTATVFFNSASFLLSAAPYPFLSRPTVAAVKSLHLMVSYLFCSVNREGARSAWTILGLASRAAQSLGLHKNCAVWQISPEEVEERSRVWWELLTYDLLQSLNFGRPYSIPMHFVQCSMPNTASEAAASPIGSVDVFHWYKYRLGLVFGKIADLLANPELPDYGHVLALDRELKTSEASAPAWLRATDFSGKTHDQSPEKIIAQKHMLALLLHKGLLALHRPWFAKALMSGGEPMCTPWAASFNACIISARRHVQIMRSVLVSAQRAGVRWWFFLFHTFTSLIIQSSVLLRAPACMLAEDIRADFREGMQIFKDVAPLSPLAQRALVILLKVEQVVEGGGTSVLAPASGVDARVTNGYGEVPRIVVNTDAGPPDLKSSAYAEASLPSGSGFFDVTSDPAGALLSSIGTPLAWDQSALDWSSLDSISETLLFWNVAHAAGPPVDSL
ncbi:hypothetical protein JCM10908_003948 [Rhodotorula pacifica]|uniref:uncharacterized protein n=1 Tax=Rhodotorula pacifica TaxID=1495444 RepID=UPI00317CDC89